MIGKQIEVLLIEDNPEEDLLIRSALAEKHVTSLTFDVESATTLNQGKDILGKGTFDVVLMDLQLPDSVGIESLEAVRHVAPEVPVVVLTGLADEELGVRAVQEGAQDYLIRGEVDANLLSRSTRYAIERHRMMETLRSLALLDDLTGLYNRRGFLTLAERHAKLAGRTGRGVFVVFVDLDNMKWINDSLGHKAGDRALKDTARALNSTFRESDIIGRMGGDEFAVLGIESYVSSSEAIPERLAQNIENMNQDADLGYQLSLSVGLARIASNETIALDTLLERADQQMYEQKQLKKRAR